MRRNERKFPRIGGGLRYDRVTMCAGEIMDQIEVPGLPMSNYSVSGGITGFLAGQPAGRLG
jgi:hypothetical protein